MFTSLTMADIGCSQNLAFRSQIPIAMYRHVRRQSERRLHASSKAIYEADEGSVAFHSDHGNDYSDYNLLPIQRQK